ncbi:MAG: hypothetical protein P8Z79_17815 [Sedimentisphaerales bacterium]
MKSNRPSFLVATIALAFFACAANANLLSTVQMYNTGVGASNPMTVWGGGLEGVDVYAGAYMFDKTAGSGEGKLWSNGTISGFCVELSEPAPEITSKYDVISLEEGPFSGPMGTAKAGYISELWGRYYNPSWASGGSYSSKQDTQAAAFAAAIWEILYEGLPVSPSKWNVKFDGTPEPVGSTLISPIRRWPISGSTLSTAAAQRPTCECFLMTVTRITSLPCRSRQHCFCSDSAAC